MSAITHSPCCIQAGCRAVPVLTVVGYLPAPRTVKSAHGMSSVLPSRGCGMAVSVAFVERQVELGGF